MRVRVVVHVRVGLAVTDGEAPLERVDVGVELRDTTVREAEAVKDGSLDLLTNESVAVAVLEALAPTVRLRVGVKDGWGQ